MNHTKEHLVAEAPLCDRFHGLCFDLLCLHDHDLDRLDLHDRDLCLHDLYLCRLGLCLHDLLDHEYDRLYRFCRDVKPGPSRGLLDLAFFCLYPENVIENVNGVRCGP